MVYKSLIFCLISYFIFPAASWCENTLGHDSIIEDLMRHYRMKKALALVHKYSKQSKKLNETQNLKLLLQKSELYFYGGDYQSALKSAKSAEHLANKIQDVQRLLEAQILSIYAMNSLGEFDLALPLLNKAYNKAQKYKRSDLERKCLVQFGSISLQNAAVNDALNYYNKAHQLTIQHKWQNTEHIDFINLGMTHCYLGQFEQAIKEIETGHRRAEALGDTAMIGAAYNLKALYHHIKNDQVNWKINIQKLLELAYKFKHPGLISSAFMQYMEYELDHKNFTSALVYGQKAKQYLTHNPMPLFEVYVDSIIYEVYKRSGSYERALSSFESFHQQKAAILTKQQVDNLNKIKSQFALNEKNLTIKNQQLKIDNNRKNQYLLLLVNIILLLFIVIFIVHLLIKNRHLQVLYRKEKIKDDIIAQEKRWILQAPNKAKILKVDVPSNVTQDTPNDFELITEDRRELFDEMIQLIEKNKLYLNPNLDLKLVITMLGTNKFYLYQAMSQHSADNFRNLINRYRVDEAKHLIEKECLSVNGNASTSSIYHEAGFNSLASYHRIFKNFTGLTPKEYMAEYRKDLKSKD